MNMPSQFNSYIDNIDTDFGRLLTYMGILRDGNR